MAHLKPIMTDCFFCGFSSEMSQETHGLLRSHAFLVRFMREAMIDSSKRPKKHTVVLK